MKEEAPRHSVSVAAVIVDVEGRVLAIQRRDNAMWEPPGGVLELEESIYDGLLREVREETGLQISPQRLTGVYKNHESGIVALVFRCAVVDGEAGPTAEALTVRWMPPEEVPQYMTEAYAVRVMDALQESAPAIRSHDGEHLI